MRAHGKQPLRNSTTVNLEIFTRILFSQNFEKFYENKTLLK